MSNSPLISIVVPVYKVEDYLDKCITSIISQSFERFELILVDDGSPDNCPAMCDSWAKKDSRIKVIHKQNGGLSDARNCGIEAAEGEYIWFVDSDDWISQDALTKIASCISEYPESDVIVIQIVEIRGSEKVFHGTINEWPSSVTLVSNSEVVSRFTSVLPSVKYVVKKTIYQEKKLRFIKGIIHEDMPFCHMLMLYAKSYVLLPYVSYFYRIRGGSITTSTSMKSCYSLIKSHQMIISFSDECVNLTEEGWFMGLTYDYLYEISLRLYPFLRSEEYDDFMSEYGQYMKIAFRRIRPFLKNKRRILSYIFDFSPQLYSRLLYLKRN